MRTAGTGQVRRPAVAGSFYPADRDTLRRAVDQALAGVLPPGIEPDRLAALVVPHAGYVYSGSVAGTAYRLLPSLAGRLDRVVLLGPAHYVPVAGAVVPAAARLRTPLGDVAVDDEARKQLLERSRTRGSHPVTVSDEPHAPEHSLEVQLPFLQRTLPGVPVLPVLVGGRDADVVGDLLEPWWGEGRSLLLVSTDLSHFLPIDAARHRDAATAAAVCRADADALRDEDACGVSPLRAMLTLVRRHHARVTLLDLRTSGDTAGRPERVVGYGAFAVEIV